MHGLIDFPTGEEDYGGTEVLGEDLSPVTGSAELQPLEVGKFSGHVHGDRDVINATGLKDTFHWSYAAEIDIKPNVTLRLGYEFRETSATHEYFSASSMPDLDKYGIGLGFKFKSGTTLDIAYGYVTGDYYIPNDTSYSMNSLNFTKSSTSP